MQKGQNTNHPVKGSSINIEPIRKKSTIADIKKLLADKPLDLALFTVGINTNLRASDLLSIKVDQVKNLKAGDSLELKERKTRKKKMVTFNGAAISAINGLLDSKDYDIDDFLFIGQRGSVLSVPALNLKIKRWMKRLNLKGNYGCHTLRKTWAFFQYRFFNVQLPMLMKALNHSSQAITLRYIGIQEKELNDVYLNEI
jgi:integrase